MLVRTDDPIIDPAWTVEEVSLEDIVLWRSVCASSMIS